MNKVTSRPIASKSNAGLMTVTAVVSALSGYGFGDRSKLNLKDVHPDIRRVAEKCLQKSEVDFMVIDGMRTEEEHRKNVANGRSWTLRSRHQDGKAIDVAALTRNRMITYDPAPYLQIGQACKQASLELGIPIVWGGDWKQKDYAHFELDRKVYP